MLALGARPPATLLACTRCTPTTPAQAAKQTLDNGQLLLPQVEAAESEMRAVLAEAVHEAEGRVAAQYQRALAEAAAEVENEQALEVRCLGPGWPAVQEGGGEGARVQPVRALFGSKLAGGRGGAWEMLKGAPQQGALVPLAEVPSSAMQQAGAVGSTEAERFSPACPPGSHLGSAAWRSSWLRSRLRYARLASPSTRGANAPCRCWSKLGTASTPAGGSAACGSGARPNAWRP